MPAKPDSAEQKNNATAEELRRAISTGYSAVKGRETGDAFSAKTIEEIVDDQIARLEGKGTALRPSPKARADKIEKDLLEAVEKIKTLPPEFFNDKDEDTAVNTEVTPKE